MCVSFYLSALRYRLPHLRPRVSPRARTQPKLALQSSSINNIILLRYIILILPCTVLRPVCFSHYNNCSRHHIVLYDNVNFPPASIIVSNRCNNNSSCIVRRNTYIRGRNEVSIAVRSFLSRVLPVCPRSSKTFHTSAKQKTKSKGYRGKSPLVSCFLC